MAGRLQQISSHLSGSAPKGLLAGDVAIVTGAAQGIGRATAILFAQEGAKVVVSDLDQQKAQDTVNEIKKNGGDAIAVAGDVTAQDFPKKVVSETISKYGKINILANVAGFTWDKMLHNMTDEQFDMMYKVHNLAPFRLIREAAPYLRSKDPKAHSENRAIVNVSSTSGLHGNVGQANYASAKAGVQGLTRTVAKEWGPFNVRCNTIAFGWITTRLTQDKSLGAHMIVDGKKVELGIPGRGGNVEKGNAVNAASDVPLQRPGSPEEAAKAVLFLASPLSSYITGETLRVAGGRVILLHRVRNAGKYGKVKRGGGRQLDKDGNPINARQGQKDPNDDDDDEEEDSDEQDNDDDEDEQDGDSDDSDGFGGKVSASKPTQEEPELYPTQPTTLPPVNEDSSVAQLTDKLGNKLSTTSATADARKERRSKTQNAVETGNLNRQSNKETKIGAAAAPREMSRREREEGEKKAARERYLKLHAAGKTDEAKRDMARLKEIRKQREEAAARKKEEEDAKAAAQKVALEKSGKKLIGKR
ncbi:hypothetical protein OIO90_004698 [Microbotryomycetes sp. JL221]|nr:hypothetical protein OIO90_004698 [Microbotryomycetes sp. JL221]